MKIFIPIIILLSSVHAFSQKNDVTGCYSSNFAIVGWFSTHLELKNDSTFRYSYSGDLVHDAGTGIYKVDGNFIHLSYDIPNYDTLYFKYKDSLNKLISVPLPARINVSQFNRPTQFIYKRKKLFSITDDRKIIRKNKDRNGRLRRYYLKVHEIHDDNGW